MPIRDGEEYLEKVFFNIEEWAELDKKFAIPITVVSGSMYPFIRAYKDKIMLVQVKSEDLKTGDIVLFPWFRDDSKYCLHRIVKINGDKIQTCGDYCRRPDEWINRSAVLGRVTVIYRGKLKIDCEKTGWKLIFKIWTSCRRIRGMMLFFFRVIRKFKQMIMD